MVGKLKLQILKFMTTDTSPDRPTVAQTLDQAVQAFRTGQGSRPGAIAMVEALLQAEATAKREHITYPFSALEGQWRLCFTTGVQKRKGGGIRLTRGFYMPGFTPAYISFYPEGDTLFGEIQNQISLAGISLKLTGPCRYPSKKNLLVFDFTKMEVRVGDRPLYQGGIRGGAAKAQEFPEKPVAKLPFFAFFRVTENYIAARGRGGGLAVWIRA